MKRLIFTLLVLSIGTCAVAQGWQTQNYTQAEVDAKRVSETSKQPLYVVEGQKMGHESASAIPPDLIASINVLKGNEATSKYGSDAEGGAVEMTLTSDKGKWLETIASLWKKVNSAENRPKNMWIKAECERDKSGLRVVKGRIKKDGKTVSEVDVHELGVADKHRVKTDHKGRFELPITPSATSVIIMITNDKADSYTIKSRGVEVKTEPILVK